MESVVVSKSPQQFVSKLIFNTIVPRPIAWITTISNSGVVNLAPFSFFNAITTKPPLLFVSIGKRKDGTLKDTARNILETKEFVVNIVSKDFLESMHLSGKDFPPEISEVEELNLEIESSSIVKPPRIKNSPASLECVLKEHLQVGSTPMDVFIGEVVVVHYEPKILETQRGVVGRLGGKRYCCIENELDLSSLL